MLSTSPRLLLAQTLNFALVLSSALMLWKGLSLTANSSSPIVVVLSGSMEPAFWRGDLLVLWNRDMGAWAGTGGYLPPSSSSSGDVQGVGEVMSPGGGRVGEVVVYNVVGKSIPIVHRIMRRHFSSKGDTHQTSILTKGDNNPTDDIDLYARNQFYLSREKEVIGSVVVYVPYVGYITILLSENPWLKTVMLLLMGFVVIMQRE